MTKTTAIEAWIAQGASEADARLMAAMYGAPKAADPFLKRWNINAHDWKLVACKANVKRVVTALAKAGKEPLRIYISGAFGSVYIDVGTEEECVTIRVSNHARTSSEHARPELNVFDAKSLAAALAAI